MLISMRKALPGLGAALGSFLIPKVWGAQCCGRFRGVFSPWTRSMMSLGGGVVFYPLEDLRGPCPFQGSIDLPVQGGAPWRGGV